MITKDNSVKTNKEEKGEEKVIENILVFHITSKDSSSIRLKGLKRLIKKDVRNYLKSNKVLRYFYNDINIDKNDNLIRLSDNIKKLISNKKKENNVVNLMLIIYRDMSILDDLSSMDSVTAFKLFNNRIEYFEELKQSPTKYDVALFKMNNKNLINNKTESMLDNKEKSFTLCFPKKSFIVPIDLKIGDSYDEIHWDFEGDISDMVHIRKLCGCTSDVSIDVKNKRVKALYTQQNTTSFGKTTKSLYVYYNDGKPLFITNEEGVEVYNPDKKYVELNIIINVVDNKS